MLSILLHLPDGNPQGVPGNANTGVQNYKNFISNPSKQPKSMEPFLAVVFEFEKVEQLFAIASSSPSIGPVISSVLETLAAKEDAEYYLSVGSLIQYYANITELTTPDKLENLVRTFVRGGKLVAEMVVRDFTPDSVPIYILAIKNTTGQEHERFNKYLVAGLRNLDKETWLEMLINQGPVIEMLLMLCEENAEIGLTGAFHDALREHAQKISNQDQVTLKFRERWSEIVSALEKDWRATFLRNIWDDINSLSSKNIDGILDLYEDTLISGEITDTVADESLRQSLSNIVERRRGRELKWLARLLKEKPEFHGKARQETKNTFADRVKSALNQESAQEIDGPMREIAIRIGLNPNEINKQAEEEPNEEK